MKLDDYFIGIGSPSEERGELCVLKCFNNRALTKTKIASAKCMNFQKI